VMPRKIGLSIHPHPATRLASMRPRLAMPRNYTRRHPGVYGPVLSTSMRPRQ